MKKEQIPVPEIGTYKWHLFDQWSKEFRHTHADHIAYIALNFAGALDACRSKLQRLIEHHRAHKEDIASGLRHQRALARLQNTMSGAAMAYENCFRKR